MKEIRNQGTKVLINGQGADEAFAGYGRYAVGYRLLDSLLTSHSEFLQQFGGARKTMGFSMTMLISQLIKACFGRKAVSNFRARFMDRTLGVLSSRFHIEHRDHLDDLGATFRKRNMDRHLRGQLEHYGFNQILHYEDMSSMAHSIEIRSPFIDYRLIEFAFRIPDSLKLDNGITKRILRDSFKGRIPEKIVGNHFKIGFNTPFDEWIRTTEMQMLLKELFNSPEFTGRSIWKAQAIRENFEKGNWTKFPLWRFINLELWARAYGINNL
jgi:asparagine synthase (glutamine-hydrolysing)